MEGGRDEGVKRREGGNRFNKDIGKQWLGNRVVNEWNWLSGHIIRANTLQCFKYRVRGERGRRRSVWQGG